MTAGIKTEGPSPADRLETGLVDERCDLSQRGNAIPGGLLIIKLILFVGISICLTDISRGSLRAPGSHGFDRFFAWEAIAALFLLNVDSWFRNPLAGYQLISWFLLIGCCIPLFFGVRSLIGQGKPAEEQAGENHSCWALKKPPCWLLPGSITPSATRCIARWCSWPGESTSKTRPSPARRSRCSRPLFSSPPPEPTKRSASGSSARRTRSIGNIQKCSCRFYSRKKRNCLA